jgi:hypothetical protein
MVTVIPHLDWGVSSAATIEADTTQITAVRMGTVTTAIPVQGTVITVPGSAFRLDRGIEVTASGIDIAAIAEVTQVIAEVTQVIVDTAAAVIVTKRLSRRCLRQESESSPATSCSRAAWLVLIRFCHRRLRASQVGAFFCRGLIDAVPANGLLRSCSLEPV